MTEPGNLSRDEVTRSTGLATAFIGVEGAAACRRLLPAGGLD